MVECYDSETSQWETISSTQIARNGVGLALLDGLLYAIGGHDGQMFQNMVEVYDPRLKRWKNATPLKHRRASAGNVLAVARTRGCFSCTISDTHRDASTTLG